MMFVWMLGFIQVVQSRRREESSAAFMWATLNFLAALVGRVVWFLAMNAAPVLGTCMALAVPVVMIMASPAHLGIGEWNGVEQVPCV